MLRLPLVYLLPIFWASFGGFSDPALGWGERGHDIIARVASRLVVAKQESKLQAPFRQREHMLAHLANVPDIVWRSEEQPANVRALNGPTHFINLDEILPTCSYKDIPKEVHVMADLARKKKTNLYIEVGTAPWRVHQLYTLMVEDFKRAKAADKNSEKLIESINQALLHGGIMAHFVGDLANPMHTTKDYDGWETEQGGLHKYFESDIVDAMLLTLANDVYVYSLMKKPFENEIAPVLGKDEKQGVNFGKDATFALVCDSHGKMGVVRNLDKKYSLTTRSRKVGINTVNAERKPATSVHDHYRSFVVERLALAADTLAEIWYQAWLEGGQPDMSSYQSYFYPVHPQFIEPDYIPAKVSTSQEKRE